MGLLMKIIIDSGICMVSSFISFLVLIFYIKQVTRVYLHWFGQVSVFNHPGGKYGWSRAAERAAVVFVAVPIYLCFISLFHYLASRRKHKKGYGKVGWPGRMISFVFAAIFSASAIFLITKYEAKATSKHSITAALIAFFLIIILSPVVLLATTILFPELALRA